MSNAPPQFPRSADLPSPRRGKVNWWRWFWISTLIVSLPYAWHSFYVPSNGIAWANDFASAQQQAARSGKPVILFFTGNWCVPCRIMKRNVWADEQVTSAVNAEFIPLLVDVDDPDAAAALRRYIVSSTPHTIITDSQGNVLSRKEGAIGKAEFLELIGKHHSTAAKD